MLDKGETLNQDGSYEKIMKAMRRTPTKLFMAKDISKITKKDEKTSLSALGYLYRAERIMRHVEKKDGQFQYAISIPEGKRTLYQPGVRYNRKDNTADAIKKSFSSIMTELLKLEQTVVNAFEEMKDAQAKLDRLNKVARELQRLEDV